MKILITAPSLDEAENVSGISSLVREIISSGGGAEFSHFAAGRKDGEKAGIGWIKKQFALPVRFWRKIKNENPDLVHINTALVPLSIVRDAGLLFAAKKAGKPVLLHLHGGRFLIEDFQNKFLERIAAKMLESANKILVLSEIEKQNLLRRWKNLNIEVLPNAVTINDALPPEKKASEKADSVKTIIFLGRLHESKGLREIIEACKNLVAGNYEFNFRCFGAGNEKDFFVGEMRKILGDKFFYGGVIAGDEKWLELSRADIFLLPSRYGEGLPMAMLEAMAARCVPIAADVASVRTVIKDGENGFLVEPYNAAQTAEKLEILLGGKAVWETLRENARSTVEENYSMENYLKTLDKIYREIESG